MRYRTLLPLAFLAASPVFGGQVPNPANVSSPMTTGNCVEATAPQEIGTVGAACGTPGVHATVAANISLDDTAELWPCNAASGPVTLTIPLGSANPSRQWDVKKIDGSANACVVATSGSDTLDGNAAVSLYTQNDDITLKNSQGTSTWYIQ